MHHRFSKLAVTLPTVALAAGLTMAGTGTAHAAVIPPWGAGTWAEIFAPEINSNGITLCADNFGSTAPGHNLQLWSCHGYASNGNPQRWNFTPVGVTPYDGSLIFEIKNVGSGLCIGLDPNRFNGGTIAGSNLLQESCASNMADWILAPAVDSPDPNNQFILENDQGYDDQDHTGGKWAMEANTFLDQNGNRLIAEPVSPFNSAQWFALD